MIRLYHGSNTVIEEIDLAKGRPNKDYGRGFYVTTIQEQAEKMARRVARIYGGEPYVTVFELDEELTEEMKFKKLTTQYSFHSERAVRLLKKVEDYHG